MNDDEPDEGIEMTNTDPAEDVDGEFGEAKTEEDTEGGVGVDALVAELGAAEILLLIEEVLAMDRGVSVGE